MNRLNKLHSPIIKCDFIYVKELGFISGLYFLYYLGRLTELESDLCTVHPLLLGTIGSVESSQIVLLLERLHVKNLTAHEIVHHHILPLFKSEDWQVC